MMSTKRYLGLLIAGLAFLGSTSAAHAQSAPRPGQGHSRMSFSPVKAKFSKPSSSFASSFSRSNAFAGGVRVNGITGQRVGFRGTNLGNTAFSKPIKFRALSVTRQTDIGNSNFAKSRTSFKNSRAPKFVTTVKPVRR